MIKTVVFDLDNTLVNFIEAERKALETTGRFIANKRKEKTRAREYGRLLFELYMEKKGDENAVFTAFEKKARIPKHLVSEGRALFEKERKKHLRPYPGVKKTLSALAQRYRVGVLTDTTKTRAKERLELLNLTPFIDFVITSDDTGEQKPSARAFTRALHRAQCLPEECVMVGDSMPRDIMGARACGLWTVYAAYGEDPIWKWEPVACTPDYVIYDIRMLPKVLACIERELQRKKKNGVTGI